MNIRKTYKIPVVVDQLTETTFKVMIIKPDDRRWTTKAITIVKAASCNEALWIAMGMVKEGDQEDEPTRTNLRA